jgi:hypothetical protein
VADAVVGGRLSAVLACERHGTAARGQQGYRAGHQLGLLLRTLHQELSSEEPGSDKSSGSVQNSVQSLAPTRLTEGKSGPVVVEGVAESASGPAVR